MKPTDKRSVLSTEAPTSPKAPTLARCPGVEVLACIGIIAALAAILLWGIPGCSPVAGDRPNVLIVMWDTVRADRMSLYGHDRPTTPFVEEWARGARVFDNCASTANSTVPSHGSLFTGLLPLEHGANMSFMHLDDRHETLAEIFNEGGYRTYLYSANPHISRPENFNQGFEVEEHPWSPAYRDRAMEILRAKIDPRDRSSELPAKFRNNMINKWTIKASGELAREGLISWLGKDDERPFFAFLNYMEAHRPFVPSSACRRQVMNFAEVERSFKADRSWVPMWLYTFGMHEYAPEDLEIMALTYDACIADLDVLFKDLIGALDARGYLDNTIVVLVSDHGEHLGEHHMLDHQYSVYEGLIRVPLIVHFPDEVEPGRETAPVSNYDLFPTLLELAGLEPPGRLKSRARSLLDPETSRPRLAEYLADFTEAIKTIKRGKPDWDPAPFQRRLSALYLKDYKLIHASDGRHELYDVTRDPGEEDDLSTKKSDVMERMLKARADFMRGLKPFAYDGAELPGMSPEQIERLKALGYMGSGGETSGESDASGDNAASDEDGVSDEEGQ